MLSIRIRRAVSILTLALAASILPIAGLHAAPRDEPRSEHRVIRRSFPVWSFLVSLWDQAGLRIDDNG